MGRRTCSFEQELGLWFFIGVVRQRWKDRKQMPKWAQKGFDETAKSPSSSGLT
jgi:hypothetical protein